MKKLTRKELLLVNKPVRYIGGEYNQYIKDRDNKVRICNAYSNLYEIGIKQEKFNMLYNILNLKSDVWCERTFFPYHDMLSIMHKKHILLQTLESKDFVKDLDIINFNANDVLEYSNIIKMLELSGINIYSKDRIKDKSPFIIATGQAINENCLSLSDFIDFFIIGEVEDVLVNIIEKYKEFKTQNLPKIEFLRSLKNIQGVYIPSIHKSNNLIYSAKNNENYNLNVYKKSIVPNMYEVYKEDEYKTIDIFTNVNRLRNLFGMKKIDQENILKNFKDYISDKYNVEIRFTIGLPDESYEDLKLISDFVNSIIQAYNTLGRFNKVNIIFENFIIYPHTKLEWYRKNDIKTIINKQKFIQSNIDCDSQYINIIYFDAKASVLKQILLFAEQNTCDVLFGLKDNNFIFYKLPDSTFLNNLGFIEQSKYKDYLKEKDLEYKFGFDSFIIDGNQKIRLKKEYKKFLLMSNFEKREEESL